jgi:D-sedoheptulose 7-phosphate isomerase
MKNYILTEFTKSKETFERILKDEKLLSNIETVVKVCIDVLKNGNKIMFCGNGGSAADSQHLAAELVSKQMFDRPALNAIALTVDTSALTAIGNDYGYIHVFSRQIKAIGSKGDLLFAFSTSGKSVNVIEAVKVCAEKGIITVGMLGEDGRDIGALVDYSINIPSKMTPNIQEGHISTGHVICALIEEEFFAKEYKK